MEMSSTQWTPSSRSRPPATSSTAQVRVVLRARPSFSSEPLPVATATCVSLLGSDQTGEITVLIKDQFTSRNEVYKLDSFFGPGDGIRNIFDQEVSSLIPGIFRGVNATVLAYGATGSGKTYTMQGTNEEEGIIPLAMSAVLALCINTWCVVEMAYYEIYLDKCYDLLEPKVNEISILNDKDGCLQLKGLSRVAVQSMDEFHELYSAAIRRRKVAHTSLNDVSSRSHAVLAITVTDGEIRGKLNLIDLAGNEDNRRTSNEGIRLQESSKINQSLFALSKVIYALNNDKWVPYRDSKLTRILQDSLGGKSQSLMIACVNPAVYQETVHTVSLAARSRRITNHLGSASKQETPQEREDMEAKLRAWLESKGRTKSTERLTGLFSPKQGRTPMSLNNQPGSVRSCTKATFSHTSNPKIKKKIVFQMRIPGAVSTEDDIGYAEAATEKLQSEANKEAACEADVTEVQHSAERYDSCATEKAGSYPGSQQDPSEAAMPYDIAEEIIADLISNTGGTPIKEGKIQITQTFCSQSFEGSTRSFRTPFSAISSNVQPIQPTMTFTPKSPTTASVHQSGISATPLHKFNALSSSLKETLLQEYLDFLNNASKEELMQLKGIGEKRSGYILQLREESPRPLKSLADLSKIGLSLKQVDAMFRSAAKGVFT